MVINQKVGLVGNFLRSWMRVGLPLITNALTPLAKIILILLDLKAAASAANEAIQIKIYGLHMTPLIIWKEKIKDVMKIDK